MKLFAGAPSAFFEGNGIINSAGNATNFQYYGLASNTNIVLTGGGGFTGLIYAPAAEFSCANASASVFDFVGASLTKTARVTGLIHFHYDEALKR